MAVSLSTFYPSAHTPEFFFHLPPTNATAARLVHTRTTRDKCNPIKAHSSFVQVNRPFRSFPSLLHFFFDESSLSLPWNGIERDRIPWEDGREGGRKNKRSNREKVISRSDCHLVTKARVRERIIYRTAVAAVLFSRQARGMMCYDRRKWFHGEIIFSRFLRVITSLVASKGRKIIF